MTSASAMMISENPSRHAAITRGAAFDIRTRGAANEIPTSANASTTHGEGAADACGVPVIAGPVEATALGNVLVQAMSAGDISSLHEIREVVRRSESITEFHPKNNDGWDDAWERFRRICEV